MFIYPGVCDKEFSIKSNITIICVTIHVLLLYITVANFWEQASKTSSMHQQGYAQNIDAP